MLFGVITKSANIVTGAAFARARSSPSTSMACAAGGKMKKEKEFVKPTE